MTTGKRLGWSTQAELIRESARRPVSWLLGIAMVGVVFVAGKAMDAFPSLQRDPSVAYFVVGVIFLIALLLFARARHRLMPWGSQARSLMWGGLAGFSAVSAFASWAAISFANGALDRTPDNWTRFSVVGRTRYRDHYLVQLKHETTGSGGTYWNPLSVDVNADDWESAEVGSLLLVDLRPGFFRLPWVAGYRLCDPETGSCSRPTAP